jgi:hypothetical protein
MLNSFFSIKNNVKTLSAYLKEAKIKVTQAIDPVESNMMIVLNYMIKSNDNEWTEFKNKKIITMTCI